MTIFHLNIFLADNYAPYYGYLLTKKVGIIIDVGRA